MSTPPVPVALRWHSGGTESRRWTVVWLEWRTGNEDQPLKKVKKGNITWAFLTSANRTLTNTTTNSPMPFLARFSLSARSGAISASCLGRYLRVNALLADKLLPLLQDDALSGSTIITCCPLRMNYANVGE